MSEEQPTQPPVQPVQPSEEDLKKLEKKKESLAKARAAKKAKAEAKKLEKQAPAPAPAPQPASDEEDEVIYYTPPVKDPAKKQKKQIQQEKIDEVYQWFIAEKSRKEGKKEAKQKQTATAKVSKPNHQAEMLKHQISQTPISSSLLFG